MRAPPSGESPMCQRPPVERTIESPMARPRPAPAPSARWNRSNSRGRSASGMPGPLSSTVRLTRLPWARTWIRTWPSGPACRQALSIRTPASRSIHSGGALISAVLVTGLITALITGPSGISALTAGPTARNRSAQAWARVARSTGSLPGGGGRESNLASHSMSSTSWRSRWLSPRIRPRASRYSVADRGADRATSASALITLSGVRSSCEASAVNSSWRRRDCSTGACARRPTSSAPRNIASSTTGPVMSSALSSTRWVRATPARLWPAISQPPACLIFCCRNWGGGRAGAPGLCPVTVPAAFVVHRNTGTPSESVSVSPARPDVRASARRLSRCPSTWPVRCWPASTLRTITATT